MWRVNFKNILLTEIDYKAVTFFLWIVSLFLFCMGFSRQLEYFFAPFVCLFAFMIVFQNQTKPIGMVRLLLLLLGISFITSYHIFFYYTTKGNILQYICYPSAALLSSYAMYSYLSCRKKNVLNWLRIFFTIFFAIAVYRFVCSDSLLLLLNRGWEQNNYFYLVLMPLPILFINSKSYVNYLYLLICLYVCVCSLKRSALISISLVSTAFLFFQFYYSSISKKIFVIFLGIVCAFFLTSNVYFIQKYEKSIERMDRIKTDGGSGRTNIITNFLEDDIYDLTTFPEIFVGNGFESISNKYERKLAALHNDWLEILYSYGFVGLLLYISFLFKLVVKCFNLFKEKSPFALSAVVCLILFVVYGFVANVFYFFFYSAPLFLMVGILDWAEYNLEKRKGISIHKERI